MGIGLRKWSCFLLFAVTIGQPLVFGRGGGGHSGGGSSSGSHSSAPVPVSGYTTKSGTYVEPHFRSHPDGTTANNWSTKGNVNPYTGKVGTKSPDGPQTSTYQGSGSRTGSQSLESGQEAAREINRTAPNQGGAQVRDSGLKEGGYSAPVISARAPSDPILEFQKKNAAKGSPESMRAMGLRYLDGNGVEQDDDKAKELLNKAAVKGDLPAQRKLKSLNLWPAY